MLISLGDIVDFTHAEARSEGPAHASKANAAVAEIISPERGSKLRSQLIHLCKCSLFADFSVIPFLHSGPYTGSWERNTKEEKGKRRHFFCMGSDMGQIHFGVPLRPKVKLLSLTKSIIFSLIINCVN